MSDATSQEFWKNLLGRLQKITENQGQSDEEETGRAYYDTITVLGPPLSDASRRYPPGHAASREIGRIPSLIDQCLESKGRMSSELIVEMTKAILTMGYLLVNPMKDDQYSRSDFANDVAKAYDFPSLAGSIGQLYEEVTIKPIRLELA